MTNTRNWILTFSAWVASHCPRTKTFSLLTMHTCNMHAPHYKTLHLSHFITASQNVEMWKKLECKETIMKTGNLRDDALQKSNLQSLLVWAIDVMIHWHPFVQDVSFPGRIDRDKTVHKTPYRNTKNYVREDKEFLLRIISLNMKVWILKASKIHLHKHPNVLEVIVNMYDQGPMYVKARNSGDINGRRRQIPVNC